MRLRRILTATSVVSPWDVVSGEVSEPGGAPVGPLGGPARPRIRGSGRAGLSGSFCQTLRPGRNRLGSAYAEVMTTLVSRLATCTEVALRMIGATAAILAMFGLVVSSWTWGINPVNVVLTWLGLCALIRLAALALDSGRPRRRCYVLALVPAASPYLVVLAVFGVWAPMSG